MGERERKREGGKGKEKLVTGEEGDRGGQKEKEREEEKSEKPQRNY